MPCIRIEHLSPQQVRAFRIADNKVTESDWEYDFLQEEFADLKNEGYNLELTGFTYQELAKILPNESPEEDMVEVGAYERAKALTKIILGEVYVLGSHRLMCGDATKNYQVEILMNGKKAQMCFTDPPYGVSYSKKNEFLNTIARGNSIQIDIANDAKEINDLADSVIYPAFCQIKSSLDSGASYYITAPQGGELLMMMMMMKAGLILRHMLIWVKNNHVLGRTDYNYKHEPILYGWIDKHKFYGRGQFQFSTWEIDKPNHSDLHPTMKPIALITNALLNSSQEGETIIDFFGGSGSTLIACEQTNRICYMMEIDPAYCQIIIDRWEKLTGKKAEKVI